MADWVDPASSLFEVRQGEAKRRQRADDDKGDDYFAFVVGREVVEVNVEEIYVDDCFKETLKVLLLMWMMMVVIP